nr:L,D-transpeptidase family protein [uncultured Sphingomonas sp.]
MSLFLSIPLLTMFAGSSAVQQVHARTTEPVSVTVERLKPGEFIWEPLLSSQGPLLLVVNLPRQRAILFRNGVPVGASTISSGREGLETPTGVFTVLQKRREHYSSTYDNAPMPYMQRLTWRGVALHAGNLPGYPASHGCVRLPLGFAKLLYGVSHVGMTVVVTASDTTARVAPARSLLGGGTTENEPLEFWRPELAPIGPVSIVVSATDRRALILRDGSVIGRGSVTIDGPVRGTTLYMLQQDKRGANRWLKVDMSVAGDPSAEVAADEWSRFQASPDFRSKVASLIRPGTTVIVTDDTLETSRPGTPLKVLEGDAPQPR